MTSVNVRGGAVPRSDAGEARRTGGGKRRAIGSARLSVGVRSDPSGDTRLLEIQRSRLLAAAVGAIDEFGYGHATVAQITSRARVSRRTFYELFGNREDCLIALIDDAVATVEGEVAAAGLSGLPWRERVRGGLAVILSFLDREPGLAQVCVVQILRGGSQVLERRGRVLARLAGVLDEGSRESSRGGELAALTAEGLVGAAYGIIHARLQSRKPEPLAGLVGELMSMIVLPYLGPAAARREQARPLPVAVHAQEVKPARAQADQDPLQRIPMRLTYRTTRVLTCIAQRPSINNRGVAERAGVSDQGQISKLLTRLQRLDLIENRGAGHAKGEPNSWSLTPLGQLVVQRLQVHTSHEKHIAHEEETCR